MENRRENLRAVASIGACAALVFVGVARMLSYIEGTIGDIVRDSILGFLGYDPESVLSAQFFKILATPSVVALIYFLFRWRNARMPSYPRGTSFDRDHRLDFESPILRGLLTSVITIHWVAIEWWKFNVDGFYPWSALENPLLNIGVLILGQALTFWSMKYLSFAPVR